VKCPEYGKLVNIKDLLEEEMQRQPSGEDSVQFDFDPMNTL
jgi:hypothetical protein